MTYTTSTSTSTSTSPIVSETIATSPYYVYSTLPAETTITYSYCIPSPKKENKEYICNYCGTRYIDTQGGFIPNCKNCGAKLDKVEGE